MRRSVAILYGNMIYGDIWEISFSSSRVHMRVVFDVIFEE